MLIGNENELAGRLVIVPAKQPSSTSHIIGGFHTMPLSQAQIQLAQATQHAAAHDQRPQIRLVAGPGTGKSSSIEARVLWLMGQGVPPASIRAVSFTRASALDLRERIHAYGTRNGQAAVNQVRVTTLHSLALQTLRAAGQLTAYPVDPIVMDPWELENVFDAEFVNSCGFSKKRGKAIRQEHEAYWSNGQWGGANYVSPVPPVTHAERTLFATFHGPRTQSYSCVLPGEIIRQCVESMSAGIINAVSLLNLNHLIVDEYQDLNPMDIQFIDEMISQGAHVFIAGDDDQSIYSFRYATPSGIQTFISKHKACGQHTLNACFRCTPTILHAAQTLIAAHPQPNRISKNLVSLYATAQPPVTGIVHRWRFTNGKAEAEAVATSCRELIGAGINPRDIIVLLSNKKKLLPILKSAFASVNIQIEPPREEGFTDSNAGRLVLSLIRIVCDSDDYVAHRVLLGIKKGVGITTCSNITDAVINGNMNYKDVFYQPLPTGIFNTKEQAAITNMQMVCSQIHGWLSTDAVHQRLADVTALVHSTLGSGDAQTWQSFANSLPVGTTLAELRDLLWADTDEQQEVLLQAIMTRLGVPIPSTGLLTPRVRVMTMHGAKGLSGKVVFIPGLEEDILPGDWRRPYPGLVLEAARLLYVSITRARAACILSYAQRRTVHGSSQAQVPSRFTANLGGAFVGQLTGFSAAQTSQIMFEISNL